MRLVQAVGQLVEEDPRRGAVPCCEFVRRILRTLYGEEYIDVVPIWRWNLWADKGAGPWEPVVAARDAQVADVVSTPPASPVYSIMRWHVVQGWRGEPLAKGVTGHTFFARPLTNETWAVVDATERREPSMRFEGRLDLEREYAGGLAVARLRRTS